MIEPIPKGLKCFELVEIIDFDKGEAIVRHCPYWVQTGESTYKCLFLGGEECEDGDDNFKIWNLEKECSVNLYDNYDRPEFYFNLED